MNQTGIDSNLNQLLKSDCWWNWLGWFDLFNCIRPVFLSSLVSRASSCIRNSAFHSSLSCQFNSVHQYSFWTSFPGLLLAFTQIQTSGSLKFGSAIKLRKLNAIEIRLIPQSACLPFLASLAALSWNALIVDSNWVWNQSIHYLRNPSNNKQAQTNWIRNQTNFINSLNFIQLP